MNAMFKKASSFNQPITMDTSKVTDMSSMFADASSFNQPITMDTSNVVYVKFMFENASSFNQPITMDLSKVIDLGYMACFIESMFEGATAMTHPMPSEAAGEEKEAVDLVSNFF